LALLPISNKQLFEQGLFRGPRKFARGHRLHFVDQAAVYQDGLRFEPRLRSRGADRKPAMNRRQVDLAKAPRRRHQQYLEKTYDPSKLGEQLAHAVGRETEECVLRSPLEGLLSVVRDDLFMRVVVDGLDIFK